MKIKNIFSLLSLIILGLNSCQYVLPSNLNFGTKATSTSLPTSTNTPAPPTPTFTPVPTFTATSVPPTPTPLPVGPNPEDIPDGYNPLTGLPAEDPSALMLPAVLISITNFPPSARPQSGLSFSPWVYEIYIAEGMTRFLATFYGAFPKIPPIGTGKYQGGSGIVVGPVRSGRLPYVYIRDFFQGSCLVYAGATVEIREKLRGCAMVYGTDESNINSAMLDVTRMKKIAEENKRPDQQFNYTGNVFTTSPQAEGAPANQIDVYYSYLNQSQWKYDGDAGAYLKFDDFADGSGKFTPATDRLTGEQLAFANVIVLYTEHTVLAPYILDVKMGPGQTGKAVIFRDGQKFDATWSTVAGEYEKSTGLRRPIRFETTSGELFALKPGHSWVHIVTPFTEVLGGAEGKWNLRFYAPAGAK